LRGKVEGRKDYQKDTKRALLRDREGRAGRGRARALTLVNDVVRSRGEGEKQKCSRGNREKKSQEVSLRKKENESGEKLSVFSTAERLNKAEGIEYRTRWTT